jgi:hypothetical protein
MPVAPSVRRHRLTDNDLAPESTAMGTKCYKDDARN